MGGFAIVDVGCSLVTEFVLDGWSEDDENDDDDERYRFEIRRHGGGWLSAESMNLLRLSSA